MLCAGWFSPDAHLLCLQPYMVRSTRNSISTPCTRWPFRRVVPGKVAGSRYRAELLGSVGFWSSSPDDLASSVGAGVQEPVKPGRTKLPVGRRSVWSLVDDGRVSVVELCRGQSRFPFESVPESDHYLHDDSAGSCVKWRCRARLLPWKPADPAVLVSVCLFRTKLLPDDRWCISGVGAVAQVDVGAAPDGKPTPAAVVKSKPVEEGVDRCQRMALNRSRKCAPITTCDDRWC